MLRIAEWLPGRFSADYVTNTDWRGDFYEIKEAFEKYGAEGLAPQPRRRPRMPNQTPPELEARILEMTEQYPAYSYLRISQQLKLVGIGASPSAVRCVWQRQTLRREEVKPEAA